MIIEAFEQLAARQDDVHLALRHIHDDEPLALPQRFRDRIHTIGYVSYDEMADYYRAAGVCVSIASTDSSPRSVWPRGQAGCATTATRALARDDVSAGQLIRVSAGQLIRGQA